MSQKKIYDTVYLTQERDYWSEVRVSLFKGRDYGKVLDIGCGAGYPSTVLKHSSYTGADISPHAGFLLKKCVVMKDHRLPFKTGMFDTVFMFEVIEHVPDPLKTLQEARRVLKKGGRVILTTPNDKNLLLRFYEWVKKNPFVRRVFGRSHISGDQHEHLFTSRELGALLKKAGMRNIIIKDIGLGLAFLFSFLVYGRFSTPFSKRIIAFDYKLPAFNGYNLFVEAIK